MRRAKIICTLGPSSATPEIISDLMVAGLDVARLNFSHGTHETHRQTLELVRKAALDLGRPVAILADLQGPKIRVGKMAGGDPIQLDNGAELLLTADEVEGTPARIPHTYCPLHLDVSPGDRILLDDGRMELQVLGIEGDDVRCQVVVGGTLSDRKGMNLPGVALSTPSLTDKDRADLAFAAELGVDYLAISFVRHPEDVAQAQELEG